MEIFLRTPPDIEDLFKYQGRVSDRTPRDLILSHLSGGDFPPVSPDIDDLVKYRGKLFHYTIRHFRPTI